MNSDNQIEEGVSFTRKYRPESLDDVQGNNTDLEHIKNWAKSWTEGDKPILLYGPPGVGKTATVQALANDMDWQLAEVNASSARTTDDVRRVASQITGKAIDGSRILVFLDEVDSFPPSVSFDPLIEVLKDPPTPVILVGNEEWKIPGKIKRYCDDYEFSLGKRSIKSKLRKIAEAEDVPISGQDLGKLATRGNLRAAINDLQTYAETGQMGWDDRQLSVDNFDAVDNILKGKRFTGDMTPPDLVVWLDENLTSDFRLVEAAMAYESLARADKWLGRTNRTQNYHWWRYAGDLADWTAELRLSEPYGGWIDKSYPEWWRHSTPKPTDEDPVAELYRALSGWEDNSYGFSGNYIYFREVILPFLTELPKAVRLRLALNEGLSKGDSALEALDISDSEYDNWMAEEVEEPQTSIDEW